MGNGTTSRGACLVAATVVLLGVGDARFAAAGDAVLEARMLPPVLATDFVTLRALPASAAAIEPGIYFERTEPDTRAPEQVLPFEPKNRGAMLVGQSRRLAVFADDVTRAVALASPRGWGVVVGYEASRVEKGESSVDILSSQRTTWETASDQRYQFGVGWRSGDEETRAYEIGLLGSLFDSRGDDTTTGQLDTLNAWINWTGTRSQDVGIGLTLRTLSVREGLQLGFSVLYEDPRASLHHAPGLHQRRREVRLDGGWRLRGTQLDDLVVGASLLWSDHSTLVASTHWHERLDRDEREEGEVRETIYAGIAFVSIEESIVPGLVLRAGARAPAQIRADRENWLPVYVEGGYGSLEGEKDAEGSVREAEIAVGLGGRWRRLEVDCQLKSKLETREPVLRWSLTVLL